MVFENIILGQNVSVDPSASINNIKTGDNVKIAKRVTVFGSKDNLLKLGDNTYIGPNTFINGFADKVIIGKNVSIAQNVNIMTDSGPNASPIMQRIFPIIHGPVTIEDHVWIGASVIVMPNITIGRCSIVAANSFVNKSFPPYSVIGGTPAELIRSLTSTEIEKLKV